MIVGGRGGDGTGRASSFASRSRKTCGNHSSLLPSPPTLALGLARGGECYPAWDLGASAVAAPQGLQGEPRMRRLLSSRSLRLRLPQPGAAPSTEAGRGSKTAAEEPTRPGAGGTELEGPPEGSTNPLSRSSLRASLGSPDSPQGSLLFRFSHFPPPPIIKIERFRER